jgi:alkylation response protein AidB-like acyl-CoA dehydrogenase
VSADEEVREDLRGAVRRALERSDGPRPHLHGEPGTTEPHDAKLWRALATDVGVAGLVVPEELGGSGAGLAELAVVAGELGRTLAPVPFLSTVGLATMSLLAYREDAVAADLLGRIAEGDATATLAFCGDGGSWEVGSAQVRAEEEADGWRVTGSLAYVVDGASADVLLVPAGTGSGLGLFSIEAGADGVRRSGGRVLDLTRPLASVRLDRASARLIGSAAGSPARLRSALDLVLVLLAVEQVGGAQRCLDEAVAYARQRVQFDRPIGSFQAIKHTLVDVLLRVEMARSAADSAVAVAEAWLRSPAGDSARKLALSASLAKATCAEAYMHTAEETLHVFGGIGFTWEHDAHLHYRRAKAGELFLGTPDSHRNRLAVHAGL